MSSIRTARGAQVILYDGSDYELLTEARQALDAAEADLARAEAAKAQPASNARGGGSDEEDRVVEARAHLADCERAWDEALDVASERATGVRLVALGRKRWRSLLAEHKPRKDDKDDDAVGYNRDTFADAVVPACLAEPAFDVPADRDEWLDSLSEGEFEKLFLAALGLNVGAPVDPKDLARSAPRSAETGA